MNIIGIDPGNHGALAFLSTTGVLYAVADMPVVEEKIGQNIKNRISAPAVWDTMKLWIHGVHGLQEPFAVFMEQQVAMGANTVNKQTGEKGPRRALGATSIGSFFRGGGVIEGICAVAGLPFHVVPVGRWKKVMQCPTNKDAARARAMQLFPQQAHLFSRKKDDGRAEASLIAAYGQRILNGG